MRCILASGNQHKLREITDILNGQIELTTQASLNIDSVPETGLTFVENALIKARHATRVSGLPAISDDSGLEVRALGGRPGIYSARYAGPSATDEENVTALLSELADQEDRQARFHCVIVLLEHELDPTPIIAIGTWAGRIAARASGSNGFGYDPVFIPQDRASTAAELSATEKNAISHRGRALGSFAQQFEARYGA
jgi:XTP/dITP diphosphohydrolase